MRGITGSGAGLLLACAAWSTASAQVPPSSSPPDRTAKPTPEPQKRVCRTEVVTGSLVQKRRVCMTVAERAAAARTAQGTLRGMSGAGCIGGEGC